MKYPTLFERLVANTAEPASSIDCWTWTGERSNRYGKLSMRRDGRHVKCWAHREMEHAVRGCNEFDLDDDPLGPILVVERPRLDTDETIDHLCGNTYCTNPDHWGEPIPNAENARLRHCPTRRARAGR